MKSAILCVLFATCALAKKFTHPKTCPAAIFNVQNGKVRDDKNYVNGKASTRNDVLFITDWSGKGIATVNVPANKNNWAADIIIKDGLMVIEAGAEYSVSRLVEECGKNDCVSKVLDKKETGFDYSSNSPVSCGQQKCDKTCNKQTCDYWGKEEDYSCKSLEDEYGCDCFGCKCTVDHVPCSSKLAKKRCNGKTCDEWNMLEGISCAIMEKDFKCSCSGCKCQKTPVCDAGAQKKCTDAYKLPCTKGKLGEKGIKCGACKTGFKSNGKGDCDQIPITTKKPTTTTPGVDSCGKTMGKSCAAPKFKGDNFCDDDNNRAGCNWDGGDCCGDKGKDQRKYCSACKCLDCKSKPKHTDPCVDKAKKKCGQKQYKGDKNCDDENNNAGCNWDGGDCCGKGIKKTYCKECLCKDCQAAKAPGDTCVVSAKKSCGFKEYKGDGNCDDDNNNAGCAWDGGDCCGDKVKTTYCKKCACLDCTKKTCPKSKVCGSAQYKGDGNCDDENNVCGCGWDGGDCCGTVKKNYCKLCKCLDPDFKKPKCGSPAYKGDGNCDDENNIKDCNYDGGDCCQNPPKNTYCKVCKCLDPSHKPKCGSPAYKKDGNCDDENNIKECDYDGGDCCQDPPKNAYCKVCKCLDPSKQKCQGACGAKDFKGDGICDDTNNNCGCQYDGGDCCADTVKGGKLNKNYCQKCECKKKKG